MYLVDFSFGDEKLSDFGCIVANISTGLEDVVSLGSELSYETVLNNATLKNHIVKATYENPITVTFDICKNPCIKSLKKYFTSAEISQFMRWLNKKAYDKFSPIYNDSSFNDIYYYGSFNIKAIKINGDVCGFNLTFTANSPFGYLDAKPLEFQSTVSGSWNFEFYDNSDEIGYTYPDKLVVTCLSDGDLIISSNMDAKSCVIKNCKKGEVITMDCLNRIITSSIDHSKLYNDFNYSYPRFKNTEDNNLNKFTVSIPATIYFEYSPIRKVGVIV